MFANVSGILASIAKGFQGHRQFRWRIVLYYGKIIKQLNDIVIDLQNGRKTKHLPALFKYWDQISRKTFKDIDLTSLEDPNGDESFGEIAMPLTVDIMHKYGNIMIAFVNKTIDLVQNGWQYANYE